MNPVYDKIKCIYECAILEEPTNKPNRTTKKRVAINSLNTKFKTDLNDTNQTFIVTGKLDGTCCRVKNTLQKRRDVKKGRKIPPTWEKTGETVGFMSLEKGDKHYLSTLKDDLIATFDPINKISYTPIEKLKNQTVELIGPKIQGNPHGLTQHCVVAHGSLKLVNYPYDFDLDNMRDWFTVDEQCKFFEGIVVHFSGGNMYKAHRHHLDMPVEKYKSLMDFE